MLNGSGLGLSMTTCPSVSARSVSLKAFCECKFFAEGFYHTMETKHPEAVRFREDHTGVNDHG